MPDHRIVLLNGLLYGTLAMRSLNDQRQIMMVALLVLFLAAYIGSYGALSRNGFAEADRQDSEGFYFFAPENTDGWRRKNFGCVYFFYPLIYVDNLLGTGRPVGCEPLWNLS